MNKIEEFINIIKNIEISQITNLVIGIFIVIVFILLGPLFSYGVVKIFLRKQSREEIKESNIYKTIKLFLSLTGVYVASKIIELQEFQNEFMDKCFIVVIIWTLARVIVNIFEARALCIHKSNQKEDIKKNALFTSGTSNILKIILYIIAVYLTLKEFG